MAGSKLRPLGRLLWNSAQVAGGLVLFRDHVYDWAHVEGRSMEPTMLHRSELFLLQPMTGLSGTPELERGDIVVATMHDRPHEEYCKRVLALPGDIVFYEQPSQERAPASALGDDRASSSRDGSSGGGSTGCLLRGFAASDAPPGPKQCTVGPGQCWLEGDNAGNSRDSRTFGPIPVGLINSKVVAKLWPPCWLPTERPEPRSSTRVVTPVEPPQSARRPPTDSAAAPAAAARSCN